MPPAQGFPGGTRYASVPLPLLGPLIQEIHSLAELKCILRVLGLLQHQRSRGLWVTLAEVTADPILLNALAGEPGGSQEAIRRGVAQSVERGTLLQFQRQREDPAQTLLLLNDGPGRRALAELQEGNQGLPAETSGQDQADAARPTIFALYEENIGPLTPLLAEELKGAEEAYPWPWIQEAFLEAVSRNRRSWRYIARILERWATEGKDHGEPGRHSQESDPKEYLRRYGHLAR